jgi:hypothetical protein
MADYQIRLWNVWHHHMSLIMAFHADRRTADDLLVWVLTLPMSFFSGRLDFRRHPLSLLQRRGME